MNDDVVVADFTGNNGNVFYELAIRHVSQKPFIHTVSIGSGTPSDLIGNRYVDYDLTDIRSVDRAQKKLGGQLDAIKRGQKPDSPFTFYALSESLRKNGSSIEADRLELLIASQQKLDSAVAKLERFIPPATRVPSRMPYSDNSTSVSYAMAANHLSSEAIPSKDPELMRDPSYRIHFDRWARAQAKLTKPDNTQDDILNCMLDSDREVEILRGIAEEIRGHNGY